MRLRKILMSVRSCVCIHRSELYTIGTSERYVKLCNAIHNRSGVYIAASTYDIVHLRSTTCSSILITKRDDYMLEGKCFILTIHFADSSNW